jgi:DDE superfamily endonuclease
MRMTGIQALERLHPSLPMLPGHVERQEFEYKRHGTQSLIANLEVATGQLVAPSIGPTRTEADFAAHIIQTIQRDPKAVWVFVTDQLNTHQSESLVRLVAEQCGIQDESSHQRQKRPAFRPWALGPSFSPSPAIAFALSTPPPIAAFLNQIEIWFSILVRRLLARLSCISVEQLRTQILAFIAYYNQTSNGAFRLPLQRFFCSLLNACRE